MRGYFIHQNVVVASEMYEQSKSLKDSTTGKQMEHLLRMFQQ